MSMLLLSPSIFARDHSFSHDPCRLHWRVTAVMLADTLERYKEREKSLISDFKKLCHNNYHEMVGENDIGDSLVEWVERLSPRRYASIN